MGTIVPGKPRQDVFVVEGRPRTPGTYTDGGYSSAVGIDATRPFGVEFPDVSEVPDWQKFDLPEVKKG